MKLFKNFLYLPKKKEIYQFSSFNVSEEIDHKPVVSIQDAILPKFLFSNL